MLSGITFTFITLISSSLTILIGLALLAILVFQLYKQRDVPLLLTTNTCVAMIFSSVLILSAAADVLRADLYGLGNLTEHELRTCYFQGFLTYERFGCFYMTLVLQAFYRLVKVIYAKHKFLQAFSFNLICILLHWVLYFVLVLPSYLCFGSLYTFYESAYYCGITYDKIGGLSYTVMNIFILPIVYLVLIYARLMYFVRRQTPQLLRTPQGRRAQRDFIVIRRILFTLITLTLPGLPNIGFLVIVSIDRRLSGAYFMYRIQWMGPAVTTFVFSIALIFITPQIKEVFTNFIHRENRVAPRNLIVRDPQQAPALVTTKI